ncbi:MAG TPA: hypothetical protein VKJ07_20040, partial [Mycobacteriales bacterium]|nr:hypothetical protein [Mycobacteriales bacterium]
SHDAFLEVSARYNTARKSAGLPVYRRLADADDVIWFMCEFADHAEMERAERMLESDAALVEVIAAMYEHLVPDSVTAMTLRDLD